MPEQQSHTDRVALSSVAISKLVAHSSVIARSGATKQSLVMQRIMIASPTVRNDWLF